MSHLDLQNDYAYRQWSDQKRADYELRLAHDFPLIIDIESNGDISAEALSLIGDQVKKYNFALYRMASDTENHLAAVKNIGAQVGLKELDKNLCAMEDRVTKLTVVDDGRGGTYIPYSNKAIKWHNDGYYNPLSQRVLAMVLHCEQPAATGGENDLLDQDMAYIHLRDENPEYIKALCAPGVMCIPENVQQGELIREQTCSAVFMPEQVSGSNSSVLAMRYTQRKHNIIWSQDALTQQALSCLEQFLDSQTPYHVRYRLKSGEGVICNNVLHTRSAFTDSESSKRVYYRARYYNRITL